MNFPAKAAIAALAIGALAASSPGAAQTLDPPLVEALSVGFRILFSVLVAVVVPVYLVKYGPANFLWFSDIGLLGIGAALWLEQPLLGSMMALTVLLPEMLWLVSFVTGAITGKSDVTRLAAYMFDARLPRSLRALSAAFHLALPPGALWLVYRYGYDGRALIAQTGLAWLVLPATLWLAPPEKNINWVRGVGHPPRLGMPLPLHFGLMMLVYPLLIYLPTHLLLRYWLRL
jgi:hypothetical protein